MLDENVDWRERLLFSEHHLSHAASAYYPSPFDRAAVLTLDGVGEWTTTSLAVGKGSDLRVLRRSFSPSPLDCFTLPLLITRDLKSILANTKSWV